MTRPTSLAALVLLVGCFSEPPSSGSSGGSTGDGTTSVAATSTGGDAGSSDESSTGVLGSSSGFFPGTTGFFPTSTGFADTGFADTGFAETGTPPSAIVFEFYGGCVQGTWQALNDAGVLTATDCLAQPTDPHNAGGGWRYPTYMSPAFGQQNNALILRANPADAGFMQARFETGNVAIESGDLLRLQYEFVNTRMMVEDVGSMTFQVLLNPPDDGMPGAGMVLEERVMEGDGTSGEIDIALDIVGPADEVTFVVLADSFVEGQGVALYNAVVVRP